MSRLGFGHPDLSRLAAWLDGASDGPDGDDITAHIDDCERCASRLDTLAETGDTDSDEHFDEDLANAIREVYEPPADLNDRVMHRISERERADREVDLFLGLFAIGKDAAELMLPPDGEES